MMLLAQLISLLFPTMRGLTVDSDCDYYQQLTVGDTYFVYNPEYPGFYSGKRACRWTAVAPPGMMVNLNCNLEIPQSNNCMSDKILISTTGDTNFGDANTYCGYGNFSIKSASNNMTIGLFSDGNSQGGRFLCQLTSLTPPAPAQCDCGWKNSRRIVGGIPTKVNEYPLMAGLVDFLIRDLYCGASIIAVKYAVTAAHCIINKQPTAVGLLVGDHNLTSGSETTSAKLLVLSQFIRHPDFDPDDSLSRNDIAIVVTATLIEFNQAVGPVCLPFRYFNQDFTGESVELLGWGTTEFTGPKSEVLLKTDVNVLAPKTCNAETGGTLDQMCTFKQGHDACQSDSGGPVLWQDPFSYRLQLLGIISSGLGCATDRPGLNTRVTYFINWILQVTPDVDYCVK